MKGGEGGNISSIPTVQFLTLAVCKNKNWRENFKKGKEDGKKGEGLEERLN